MEDTSSPGPAAPAGLPTCCAIQLPVFTQSADRALHLLGGIKTLARGLRESSKPHPIKLWLRPTDPLSHPIEAKKAPSNSFLLRVRRKKGSEHTKASDTSIVAFIAEKWAFSQLADFQFLPSSIPLPLSASILQQYASAISEETSESIRGSAGASADAMDLPWHEHLANVSLLCPDTFSPISTPQPYHIRPSGASKTEGPPTTAQNLPSLAAADYDLTTSTAAPSVPLTTVASDNRAAVLDDLADAFNTRPIWQLNPLEEYMNSHGGRHPRKSWKFQLPAVAYCVRSGAFRNCWIRLGYDPRLDPESRWYQNVSIKIASGLFRSTAPSSNAFPEEFASDDDSDSSEMEALHFSPDDGTWRQFAGGYLQGFSMLQLVDVIAEGVFELWSNPEMELTEPIHLLEGAQSTSSSYFACNSVGSGFIPQHNMNIMTEAFYPTATFSDRIGWFSASQTSKIRNACTLLAHLHIGAHCPDVVARALDFVCAALRSKIANQPGKAPDITSDVLPQEASL